MVQLCYGSITHWHLPSIFFFLNWLSTTAWGCSCEFQCLENGFQNCGCGQGKTHKLHAVPSPQSYTLLHFRRKCPDAPSAGKVPQELKYTMASSASIKKATMKKCPHWMLHPKAWPASCVQGGRVLIVGSHSSRAFLWRNAHKHSLGTIYLRGSQCLFLFIIQFYYQRTKDFWHPCFLNKMSPA